MAFKVQGMAPLVQVFDMPRSVAFYRDVLGFEVTSSSAPRGPDDFDWGWLKRDGIDLMLNTAYELDSRPPHPDPVIVAAHGDTAFYFGCSDVDAAYAELRSRGVAAEAPQDAPYGMRQLYFKDPDGYTICFQWPIASQGAQA